LTELGARLKEARTEKGYTLEDLQEITKIQKRYLVGIEEGNYSSMPGSFYVRAFIKQYAEAVGLNANEILEQYRADIPNSQASEVAQSFSQSHNRRTLAKASSSSKVMESVPKIIVGLFAVVIVIVVIALVSKKMSETPPTVEDADKPFEYEKNPITKDPEGDEDKKDDTEPTKEEEPTEENTPVQTIGQGVALSDGASFEYTVTNTDQLKVRVEVTNGRSWIGMRNAAGTEQLGANAKEYGVGEVVEFDATDNQYVRIRLGRALNVKVFINDEELQLVSDQTTQNIIIKLEAAAQ
jgi:cytoskeletal protein RodZ